MPKKDVRIPCKDALERDGNILRLTYLIACMIWIILCLWLSVTNIIIIVGPLLVFLLAFFNADKINNGNEELVFQFDFVTVGIVLVVPFLVISIKKYKELQYLRVILCMAVVFSLLSLVDLWVLPRHLYIVRHTQSILETFSLFLIIYVFIEYAFLDLGEKVGQHTQKSSGDGMVI